MSFQRQRDRGANISSRTISAFYGLHQGYDVTDEHDSHARVRDLDIVDGKPVLRDGKTKIIGPEGESIDGLWVAEFGGGQAYVVHLAGGSLALTATSGVL